MECIRLPEGGYRLMETDEDFAEVIEEYAGEDAGMYFRNRIAELQDIIQQTVMAYHEKKYFEDFMVELEKDLKANKI